MAVEAIHRAGSVGEVVGSVAAATSRGASACAGLPGMWVCAAALLNGNDQATVGIAVPTRTPSLALASIAALGGLL